MFDESVDAGNNLPISRDFTKGELCNYYHTIRILEPKAVSVIDHMPLQVHMLFQPQL